MAVNSHYIPQLLLRGFACREEGDEAYVCVYREGGRFYEANTRNVAAQRNFYGDSAIEKILSEWEGQFGALIKQLRDGVLNPSDKPLIDRFVAHSLIRTRRFRDGVHAIGTAVMENGFREFLNPERTPYLLCKLVDDIMKNAPEIRELLGRATPEERPHLRVLVQQKLQHPDMHEVLRCMILQTLPTIDTAVSVQSAQRQVLEDDRNLDKRIRDLERITWSVEMCLPNSLVLGDIGPLVMGDDSPEWGQIFGGTPQLVWFPVSHCCLLRGQMKDTTGQINFEQANLASVENSIEFFVASQRTMREEEYHKRLGSRANQLAEENLTELSAIIREYLESPGGSLTTEI